MLKIHDCHLLLSVKTELLYLLEYLPSLCIKEFQRFCPRARELRLKIEGLEEDENLAVEEIEILLEYINDQTNETFESLADAIGFLLEVG